MLFMVIEDFKNGDHAAIGERFFRDGRMMPECVVYHASWIDPVNARCYQIMEAPAAEDLQPWMDRWADLMEFQVVPVQTSKDFWATRR